MAAGYLDDSTAARKTLVDAAHLIRREADAVGARFRLSPMAPIPCHRPVSPSACHARTNTGTAGLISRK
jgi:hypothetical protein